MFKRIAAGILTVSVLGAGGGAVVHQAQQADDLPVAPPIVTPVAGDAGQNGAQNGAAVQNAEQVAQQTAQQAGEPVQAAQENVGEPWQAEGVLVEVDDFGFVLETADGVQTYVELGPPSYWQAQGVALAVGDAVSVAGFSGEAGIHTRQVTLSATGAVIAMRNEAGQPLWSGGASAGQGNGAAGSDSANGLADGTHTQQPQAEVDEWVTVSGTISEMVRSQMTITTADGQTISFQSGQPSFMATQGVVFNVGDEIEVLGFWQGDTFNAGDITKVATGERVMLRDPNGRPLWAGIGGSGGSGGANGAASGAASGGGNGYQGGR